MMKSMTLVGAFLFSAVVLAQAEIDLKHLKCLVCRTTIEELQEELAKIDPQHQIEIGSYRLDSEGNAIQRKVPKSRSEIHISSMLDSICNKMENYVRATYKSNGQLTILNIMGKSGGMNPEISNVDIIQDSDLNKSLGYYCEGVVEEWEESIVDMVVKGVENIEYKVCTEVAKLCADSEPEGNNDEVNSETDESAEKDEL